MKKWMRLGLFVFCLVLSLVPWNTAAAQEVDTPLVVVLTSQGAITPTLEDYLLRGLEIARQEEAEAVILQLDTPGGSIELMNAIVQVIRDSEIPVVVYVSPRNAMAGSAGTVITLAGHLAAMAPETTIGAASPVGSEGEDIGETLETKTKEILKASVRALTANRPAEATTLAESMIQDARAVTVDEALQTGLIDIRAADLDDLLAQMDGRKVQVRDVERTLHTRNAQIRMVDNTFIEQVLILLVNPNLVFLLLSIGVQAILIEISSPGGWVAGFVGAVCVMLAVYGMGLLPVNWVGILFLVTAFILFILDIKAPTHGALTVAGLIAFITGSLVLFNSVRLPGVPTISVPLVVGMGLIMAGSFFTVMMIALRAQRAPIKTGVESIVGRSGYAQTDLDPSGMVLVYAEQWSAEAEQDEAPIPKGTRVEVVRVDGLHLKVRRARS
jgi:membrane-bound serine protease (ClpP class)